MVRRWTKEEVMAEVEKYDQLKELREKNPNCLNAAYRLNLMPEIRKKLEVQRNPTYSKADIIADAKKYGCYKTWEKKRPGSLRKAYELDMMSELRKYLKPLRHSAYSFDDVSEIAGRYSTRGKFAKCQPGAYYVAITKGWIDVVCSHMSRGKNFRAAEYICYVYEFKNQKAYVGITSAETARRSQHLWSGSDSGVAKEIKASGLQPTYKIVWRGHNADEAIRQEDHHIKIYRDAGWKLLNVAPPGSLGGGIKYTKEEIMATARRHRTKKEWYQKSLGTYSAARARGIIKECSNHMDLRNCWVDKTDDEIHKHALLFECLSDWQKSSGAYDAAKRRGILERCISHMNRQRRGYTKDHLIQIGAQFHTISDWVKADESSYRAAKRRGLLPECTAHMKKLKRKLTNEDLVSMSRNYRTRSEWRKADESAYQLAYARDILDLCFPQ